MAAQADSGRAPGYSLFAPRLESTQQSILFYCPVTNVAGVSGRRCKGKRAA
jgi:hypothetical protein